MPVVIADTTDINKDDDMAIAIGLNGSKDRPISIVISHVRNGVMTHPVVAVALDRARAQAVLDDLAEVLDQLDLKQ